MTDVLLRHEPDGGNVEAVNGVITMSDGLETGAYLSLFGGNERDGGGDSTEHLQYWGNLIETAPERHLRSRTQYLLQSLPLVPANLLRIEDAAAADLAWFVETKIATSAEVSASIPALNTIRIAVSFEVDGTRYDYAFTRNTRATAT